MTHVYDWNTENVLYSTVKILAPIDSAYIFVHPPRVRFMAIVLTKSK